MPLLQPLTFLRSTEDSRMGNELSISPALG